MYRHRVNQHLIVLNVCNVSINKILVTEFITVSFTESKYYVKCHRSETQIGTCFQTYVWNNRMSGTKHSKTNPLLKIIE